MKMLTGKYIIQCMVFLLGVSLCATAQQEPMYGQYLINSSVLNPAQAGADNTSHWGVLARNQWVGIEGAPKTETAYVNFILPLGLGTAVAIYQDRIGPEVNINVQTDLAYHAAIGENLNLAAGIRFNFSNLRVNLSDVPHADPRNPYGHKNISSGLHVNTGGGLLLYSHLSFVGISIPRAFKNQITVVQPDMVSFQKRDIRHIIVYSGINLYPSEDATFTPSVLLKFTENAPTQLDINAIFGFNHVLDFGPLLRMNLVNSSNWFDAVGFMAGIRFRDNWHFGYMYEHPLSSMRMATWQTHEVSLRYFWNPPDRERLRAPRFFQ